MFQHVMIIHNRFFNAMVLACLIAITSGMSLPAYGQQGSERASVDITSLEKKREFVLELPDASPSEIPSLFFTPEALALLRDAINGLNVTPLTNPDQGPPKDPGVRELALGGIVYTSGEDWTIWLNGKRIAPGAIPEQVFDLNVSKEYVDIKWFDEYTNRIFPIRLRPNERFNLDGRIFLTGSHPADQKL